MTYKEQMRDPKWIEFAHDFKKARNWTCEACGTRQKLGDDLTVHHIYYLSFVKVWEHPESLLECLCWDCHKRQQRWQQEQLAAFAKKLKGKDNPKRARKIERAMKAAEKVPFREIPVHFEAVDEDPNSIQAGLKSAIPDGFNPYKEYQDDLIKWESSVAGWFRCNFPLQAGYLSVAGFAGLNSDGVLELRFLNKHHSAERVLSRGIIHEKLTLVAKEAFPSFTEFNFSVIPSFISPDRFGLPISLDEAKSRFSAMRQMLGG